MKKLSKECFNNQWYTCPFSIFIFISFLFLFIYSLIVLGYTSNLLLKKDVSNHEKYKIDTKDIMVTYILNIVVTFLSVLVLCFFLFKLIPSTVLSNIINKYVAILFACFILVVSSITIHYYRYIEHYETNVVISISTIALILSCLLLFFYIIRTFYNVYSKK